MACRRVSRCWSSRRWRAAIAAAAGYLLGTTGGYGGATFDRHLQLGIVVAIGALITALAAWRRQRTGAGDAIVRVALDADAGSP